MMTAVVSSEELVEEERPTVWQAHCERERRHRDVDEAY